MRNVTLVICVIFSDEKKDVWSSLRKCNSTWTWCSSAVKLNTSNSVGFASGEPNNYFGDENCALLNLASNPITLRDDWCTEQQFVVCEVFLFLRWNIRAFNVLISSLMFKKKSFL